MTAIFKWDCFAKQSTIIHPRIHPTTTTTTVNKSDVTIKQRQNISLALKSLK